MVALAVSLLAPAALAGSFTIIGDQQQFYPRGLSADGGLLLGDGLSPDGTSRIGMTWSAAGGIKPMPGAGAVPYSIPVAMSGQGAVIAGYNMDASNVRTAWRWTAALGYQPIAPAGSSDPSNEATAISRDGNTVVGQSVASSVKGSTSAHTISTPSPASRRTARCYSGRGA